MSPTSIAQWEDGAGTDASAGTYEWWYFDAHLADGAKLVVQHGFQPIRIFMLALDNCSEAGALRRRLLRLRRTYPDSLIAEPSWSRPTKTTPSGN
jgi:hypothetical protein